MDRRRTTPWLDPVTADLATRVAPDDIDAALALGARLAPVAAGLGDRPADGGSAGGGAHPGAWDYLGTLATLGSVDLTTARAVEPHLDALAILAQAGDVDLGAVGADGASTWGVYAAAAPGRRVEATPSSGSEVGPWTLTGEQPWCSLADRLSHALVVAHAEQGRRLFAIPLRHPGVTASGDPWVGRGLVAVTSGGIRLQETPAVPVGPTGWYLSRPGFAWGGIGVAAVWFGAAAALRETLRAAAGRRTPDQIALLHLGRADLALHAAELALRDAADRIDAGAATGADGVVLAARVRALAADAAERLLEIVGHALGPGPLVGDETHARRVADLTVYVRQHHAERDIARLGDLTLSPEADA